MSLSKGNRRENESKKKEKETSRSRESKTALSFHQSKAEDFEKGILKAVSIRENLLNEMKRLIHNQSDLVSCIPEVVELIKAIRLQTVEIIEGITTWRDLKNSIEPFLYKDENYMLKISADMNFLDEYDEIVEFFCFEFKSNPLAYRDGGNIITGPLKEGFFKKRQQQSNIMYDDDYNAPGLQYVDGIDPYRLRRAEKLIQMEFDRIDNASGPGVNIDASIESLSISEIPSDTRKASERAAGVRGENKQSLSIPKIAPAQNEKKARRERIVALKAEVADIDLKDCNLEDAVDVLTRDLSALTQRRDALEVHRRQYTTQQRLVAAQHLATEVAIVCSEINDISLQIKELQRQRYFLSIERKRKQNLARALREDHQTDARRKVLAQKLAADIKKKGLAYALNELNAKHMIIDTSSSAATGIAATASSDISNDVTAEAADKVRRKKKKSKHNMNAKARFSEPAEREFDTDLGPIDVSDNVGASESISEVEPTSTAASVGNMERGLLPVIEPLDLGKYNMSISPERIKEYGTSDLEGSDEEFLAEFGIKFKSLSEYSSITHEQVDCSNTHNILCDTDDAFDGSQEYNYQMNAAGSGLALAKQLRRDDAS